MGHIFLAMIYEWGEEILGLGSKGLEMSRCCIRFASQLGSRFLGKRERDGTFI